MRASRAFLVFILLVVCAVIGWTIYVKRNPAERFYGIGPSDSTPFTVKDRWVISWTCLGPAKITLEPTHGKHSILVTDTTTPSMGSSYETTGGEYTLHITGSWPWEVTAGQFAKDSQSPSR